MSARKYACPACKSITLQTGNYSPVYCDCNPKAPFRKVDVQVDAIVSKLMRLTPLVSRKVK